MRGRCRRRLAVRETRGVPLRLSEPAQGVGDLEFCRQGINDHRGARTSYEPERHRGALEARWAIRDVGALQRAAKAA